MDGPDDLRDHMKRKHGEFWKEEKNEKSEESGKIEGERNIVGSGLAREQFLHADQGEDAGREDGGQGEAEASDDVPEGDCVRHVRRGFKV